MMKVTAAVANAMLDACVDAIDGGTGAGYVEFWSDNQPTESGDALTGTKVATVTLPNPAFGASARDGTNPWVKATVSSSVNNTVEVGGGTVRMFRVFDGDDTVLFDGYVTPTGDGGDIELSTITYETSDTLTIPATWNLRQGIT